MSGQSILFDIIARDKASSTFNKVGESASKSESHLKRFAETAKVLAGVAGAAVVGGGLTEFLKGSIERGEQAQRVTALTAQVIKTTGGAAHTSAAQVHELSTAISEKTAIDNQQVQSGANMLLTFKDIRNEAGKGNKIFNQATSIVTDMGAAMAAASGGQLDLKSTAIQVGKALNDPIKGLTALRRVGVAFTEQQQKQIKTLVEHGHKMRAQKIILRELKSEFGGAAASQATESDRARIAVKNLEEEVGKALLPTVDKLAKFVTDDAVPAISKFVKGMQDGTGPGGEFADKLHMVYEDGKHVVEFLNSAPGPVKKYGVEVLIAGVAMSKLSGGLGTATTGLRGFVTGLGPAERGMTRTEAGAASLGGALSTLAGAAGLVALTKSAHESSLAVAGLERVGGGAAVGFKVGGPLGAAIGGTTGLLWTMKDAFSENARSTKVSLPTYKQYADTLDGVAASTTGATRALVLQRLEQSGLLDATRKLGLTDRQAVNAMMGQSAARKKLADLIQHSSAITLKQKDALEQETGAVGAARLAQLRHNVVIAKNRDELKKARTALREFMHEPASKRVSITGVESARAQLKSLAKALHSVWGKGPDLHTSGPGGIDTLLRPGARQTSSRTSGPSHTAVQNFNFGDVYAADLNGLLQQAQKHSRLAGLDGIRR